MKYNFSLIEKLFFWEVTALDIYANISSGFHLCTSMNYKLSTLYIDIIKQYLQSNGIDFPEFNRSLPASLQVVDYSFGKIDLNQSLDIWHKASAVLSDSALGLHIGSQLHFSQYGIFSYALMNSPNLFEALQLIHSYRYMLNESFEGSIYVNDDIVNYVFEFPVEHPQSYYFTEFHFASIVNLGREISVRELSSKVSPIEVNFTHSAMTVPAEYQALFNCDVQFNQPQNVLRIPLDIILTPTQNPDNSLYQFFLRNVNKIYRENLNPNIVTHQLYQLFSMRARDDSWLSQTEVAQKLNVSLSTLKRKLRIEGSSYQLILDGFRYKEARRLLEQSVGLEDISHQLGFSSSASFGRTFKRWSGLTATEFLSYRRKIRG